MKVVISQPRYLPIASYIQRLYFADLFVLLDVVQRQGRGWENRNKLLLPEPKWLTIPISSSSREVLAKTKVAGIDWIEDHKRRIATGYAKHPHFSYGAIEEYYKNIETVARESDCLFCNIILETLNNIGRIFDFKPNIVRASELQDPAIDAAKGPEKLLAICRAVGADIYVSGANGKNYGVDEVFENSGIQVKYHIPREKTYPQPGRTDFVPFMAFFDPLFCLGVEHMKELVKRKPQLVD